MLVRELDAQLEVAHGLPLTSYEVLVRLGSAPERKMRMRDLAEAALLSRSGVTRLVDRLASEGLIERCSCEGDARGAYAVLTPAGDSVLRAARPLHQDGVRRLFLERLDAEELACLSAVWDRLATPQTQKT